MAASPAQAGIERAGFTQCALGGHVGEGVDGVVGRGDAREAGLGQRLGCDAAGAHGLGHGVGRLAQQGVSGGAS